MRAARFLTLSTEDPPELATLNAGLVASIAQLKTANDAYLDARDRRVARSKALKYRDFLLDRAVAALSRKLLDELDGDRSNPRYQAVFRKPVSDGMAPMATEDQKVYVEAVLKAIQQDPAAAQMAPKITAVRQALQMVEQTRKTRSDRLSDEQAAHGQLKAALSATRLVFNAAHPTLELIYPGDKVLIRSFYYEGPSDDAPEE